MHQVAAAHNSEYSSPPQVVYSAPGSIALFGEHAESVGGTVMVGAVSQRMTVAISRRHDSSLRFYSMNFGERKKTSINTLKWRREDRWANNSKGVIAGLLEMGCKLPGLEVTIGGNVPIHVGMASSSAICVATAAALNQLLELGLSRQDMIRLAVEAESVFQQRPVGSAAAAAAVLAQPGQVMLWNSDIWTHRMLTFFGPSVTLMWVDPQVPTTEEEIAMVDQRLEEARGCSGFIGDIPGGEGLLRSGDQADTAAIGSMPEEVRRGCKHLRDDEARIAEAVQALEQADPIRFGKCLYRSHESLRDLYEISNPEIDWLVRRRDQSAGILGGRRIGFGAAASMVVLLEHAAVPEYEEKLQEYERIFGFRPHWKILHFGGGLESVPS
ncbi:galactokinase [Spirochaeta africana]|nr:galactokinase family protein [Spirochaeta africana]